MTKKTKDGQVLHMQSHDLPKPTTLYSEHVLRTLKTIHDLLQELSENAMAYVVGISSTDASRNDLSLMTNLQRSDANMMMADMLRGSLEMGARKKEDA